MKILTAREFAELTKEELARCQNTIYELDPYEGKQVRCECVGVFDLKVDKRGREWKLQWDTVDGGPRCRVEPDEPLDQVSSNGDMLNTIGLLTVDEFEAYKVEKAKREAAWQRKLDSWAQKDEEAAEARKAARKAKKEGKV